MGILKSEIVKREPSFTEQVHVAYVIEKFPSSTEYFILNEILELEKADITIDILVIRKQKKNLQIPELKNLKSKVIYHPAIYHLFPILYLFRFPLAIFRISRSPFRSSFKGFLKTFRNYNIAHFLANKLKPNQVHHIHAHFAFIASDVAQTLAEILGISYSLTSHANDIFTNTSKLSHLLNKALFMVTCTRYNLIFINEKTKNRYKEKIFTIYHGIDSKNWIDSKKKNLLLREGSINIISNARFIEKKGLFYLLKAVHILKTQGHSINCTLIGEGPLETAIQDFITEHNLSECTTLLGTIPQYRVKEILNNSHIFILPCIIGHNGDRDGLPNVLLEAMASGIPVITTSVSAIPELIIDRVTGIIVPEKNEIAIAQSVLDLQNNVRLYQKISINGKEKIMTEFDIKAHTAELHHLFKQVISEGV